MKENLIKLLLVLLALLVFYIMMNPGFRLFSKLKGDAYLMFSLNLNEYATASFSGGCFWCMEPPFEKLPGVVEVITGYTGGNEPSPTYQNVVSGNTGHRESIRVFYDPRMISYETLLDVFWMSVDPTDPGGQFADRGRHYTTAIWYYTPEQKTAAEDSKARLEASGKFAKTVVTEILEAMSFYPAEGYHQDYYIKSAANYEPYNLGSGRAAFLNETWGKEKMKYQKRYPRPIDSQIKKMLTPMQFKVTQEEGTEPPFDNAYWDNKDASGNYAPGIYVDIVSGEPLFSSQHMFDSGTGWPSFTRPLVPMHIMYKKDISPIGIRIEVRSKFADSHLGHVFDDGPPPTGLRYCMNSAAMRFVPLTELEAAGYGEFLVLFP